MKSPKPTQPKRDGNNKGVEKKTKPFTKNTKKPFDKSKQSLASKAKEIKKATEGKPEAKKPFKKPFKSDEKRKDGYKGKGKDGFKGKATEGTAEAKKPFKKPFKSDGKGKDGFKGKGKDSFKAKGSDDSNGKATEGTAEAKKPFKKPFKSDGKGKDGFKGKGKDGFKGKGKDGFNKSNKRDDKKDNKKEMSSNDKKYRKPFQTQVDKMKLIWNKIRDRATPEAQRKKLIQDVLQQIQNHILDITLRHDASRIIQCIIQYGNDQQREFVLQQVMPKFFDISKAPYGHFTVLKAITYCNDQQVMKKISQSLKGHFVSLGTHIIGARVVESVLQLYSSTFTKHLKAEFYGKNFNIQLIEVPKTLNDLVIALPSKKFAILDHMKDLIEKFHKKGLFEFQYIHQLTYEYTQELINLYHEYCVDSTTTKELTTEERAEKSKKVLTLIDEHVQLISDYVTKLLTTKPGCKVICMIVAFSTAKDRKKIIKAIKGHYLESILHPTAYLGVLRVIDVVDDTVNVQKTIFDEWKNTSKEIKYKANGEVDKIIEPAWIQIMKHPSGHKLLLRLLAPASDKHVAMTSAHGLEPDDAAFFMTLHSMHSKKAYEQRRLEHILYIQDAVTYLANEYVEELTRHRYGSRVLKAIIMTYYPSALIERLVQVYGNQPLTPLPGKEMEDNEFEADEEEEEVVEEGDEIDGEEGDEELEGDEYDEEEGEGEDEEGEEGADDVEEDGDENYEDDEEFQEQLQEHEADQAELKKKRKSEDNKEVADDASDASAEEVAVEEEVKELLPIEEDPTAHTLLKALLHLDAAYEQREDAVIPHITVSASIKQKLLDYEQQILQTDTNQYSSFHQQDQVSFLKEQIDCRQWPDATEEETVVNCVGVTLLNILVANEYTLLYQWLQSNRACFALHELFRIPSCYTQFIEILPALAAASMAGNAPVDITKIAEAHEGGKVFWRLCQTLVSNTKKQKKSSKDVVDAVAPKGKKAKKQVEEVAEEVVESIPAGKAAKKNNKKKA